jgi:hypothetical protein
MISIDATAAIEERPLALELANGHPWILHFLSLVSEAVEVGEISIHCRPDDVDNLSVAVEESFSGVQITSATPSPTNSIAIQNIHPRRRLLSAIRKSTIDSLTAPLIHISSAEELKAATEFLYKDGKGHRTPLLLYVYRPISRQMAKVFIRLGLTPNFVTTLALASALGAGIAIASGEYVWGLVGALLINAFTFFDLADGDVARLSQKMSSFGSWFDSIIDSIFEAAIIIGFGIATVIWGGSEWAIVGIVWMLAHTALQANEFLGRTSASAEINQPPMPQRNTPSHMLIRVPKTIQGSLSQPEIMRGIYAVGLIAGTPQIIAIFYATFSSYLLLRMFATAYGEYRNSLEDSSAI